MGRTDLWYCNQLQRDRGYREPDRVGQLQVGTSALVDKHGGIVSGNDNAATAPPYASAIGNAHVCDDLLACRVVSFYAQVAGLFLCSPCRRRTK
jgi:hypothetical protein